MYKITKVLSKLMYTESNVSLVTDYVQCTVSYRFEYALPSGTVWVGARIIESRDCEDGSLDVHTELSVFNIKKLN